MRLRQPPSVTELYVGFGDLLDTMAKRFRREQPSPQACVKLLEQNAVIIASYADVLQTEIRRQRIEAQHNAVPGDPEDWSA